MKEQLDILLIARPGRAQKIYESLLNSNLKFRYITFKLFPKWLKKLTGSRKMQVWGPFTINLLLFTLYDYIKYKPYGKFFERISERPFFEFFLKKRIKYKQTKLIHYWPNYCFKYIDEYRKSYPEVKTFADVYLPCEKFIIEDLAPQLEELGVGMNLDYIRRRAEILDDVMACEDNFICQSAYVANTYKRYYPDKNYYVISNGLSVSPFYTPKASVNTEGQVRKFVYCGRISIEKGCDLLLEWFSSHPNFEIHLYGGFAESEKEVLYDYNKYENVFFHGQVPKDDLQITVAQYDAGIHLSRYDAWSIAVGEVIGSGLPVVVSDQTGISELVLEYDFGEVCQLTKQSINDCILKLARPSRYNQCLINIDNYIKADHKSYGDRLVEFYNSQLKNK